MSGLTYNILEYLVWVSLGLALVVVISACIAMVLAISSAMHILAMKWHFIASRRHRHVIGPGI